MRSSEKKVKKQQTTKNKTKNHLNDDVLVMRSVCKVQGNHGIMLQQQNNSIHKAHIIMINVINICYFLHTQLYYEYTINQNQYSICINTI